MAADTKIRRKQGGNTLEVAKGGTIDASQGGAIILPTADPHVDGALWNNAGVLAISAG